MGKKTEEEARKSHQIQDDMADNPEGEATWEHESLAQLKIKVLRGHSDSVNCSKFCYDDTRIITASSDGTVKLWDLAKGINLKTYMVHSDRIVNSCHVDEQHSRLASCGWDNQVIVTNIKTGQVLWSATHQGIVTSCHFSHDGKYLVTGCDYDFAVCIWDAHVGTLIKKLFPHKSTITSCRFSPIQYRLCTTAMDRTTKIIDMMTFNEEYKNTLTLGGHINIVSSCCFTDDERVLATSSWDKTVQLWDLNAGTYRKTGPVSLVDGHEGSVSSCAFSHDGKMLVTASYDQKLVLWDAVSCIQKVQLKGHSDWVNDCDFSKDQKWILSCSKDKTVRLWNIESTDDIPVVLEHRKNIGLRIVQCRECGKSFSIAQFEDVESLRFCVFCRLKHPSRYMPKLDDE